MHPDRVPVRISPTMTAAFFSRRTSPIEAARIVSLPLAPPREAPDWAEEMLAVSRQRDRDSFMRIYDHFMPRVCLYLRGMGATPAIAEELAQEALLRLWQRADRYDPARGSLTTWLYRIARNLHIDRVRREPRWLDVQLEAEEGVFDEDVVEHEQLRQRIEQLSAVQARLIRMCYFESKTHQEISEELDMPLGTVKSHLRRAFQKLQSEVRGDS